jgi:hypothetical protein
MSCWALVPDGRWVSDLQRTGRGVLLTVDCAFVDCRPVPGLTVSMWSCGVPLTGEAVDALLVCPHGYVCWFAAKLILESALTTWFGASA